MGGEAEIGLRKFSLYSGLPVAGLGGGIACGDGGSTSCDSRWR